jgi:diguanylate cyclase (GGDEF)-like protein
LREDEEVGLSADAKAENGRSSTPRPGTSVTPVPDNEHARLAALDEYDVLDTLPERAFDDITRLVTIICGVPISVISLVDERRQWFKSKVGLETSETPRDVAFCAHAIMDPDEVMVVHDALADSRFVDNPLVTEDPGIRFYAGAPLVTPEGEAIGALCAIDREPRELRPDQLEALSLLSREVIAHLELRLSLARLESLAIDQNLQLDRLRRRERRLELAHAELTEQSRTDPLSGAANRRAFDDALEYEWTHAIHHRFPLAALMIDIDKFKKYNDSHGHPAGDAVIATVGALIQESLREGDHLARYGGDEFVVLLPETGLFAARVIAERIRRTIEAASWAYRTVTVSVGLSSTDLGVSSAAELVGRADEALLHSKTEGRNRVFEQPTPSSASA